MKYRMDCWDAVGSEGENNRVKQQLTNTFRGVFS